MRQREAAVNFRLRRILLRKEVVKVFLGIDGSGVGIAKLQGPMRRILLDRTEKFGGPEKQTPDVEMNALAFTG